MIPAADVFLDRFRGVNSGAWSGMGVRIDEGFELVVYNDCHPFTRVRATLMEEFFHIWLDHPRTELRLYSEDGTWRSYYAEVEAEAYDSGAAALVPYKALREMLVHGVGRNDIAEHFGVSQALVVYRCKVTRTYKALVR
jgi:Zn-dependent peptidase ImmA (M78 family)